MAESRGGAVSDRSAGISILGPPPDVGRSARLRRSAVDLAIFALFAGGTLWVVLRGAQSMGYNWQWYRVPQYVYRIIDDELIWGPLMRGLFVTLEITAWSALITLLVGVTTALLRLSRSYSGYYLATGYLELVRNTPLLVQMYLFYFVLAPIIGLDRLLTGILCLSFFEGAFAAEIIRGGILSVRRGQWDGATALGLSKLRIYRLVILPQAVPIMLPPLTNTLINLIKNSAIVSVIAVFDLTTEGRNVIADTFMSFEIWFTVAGMYLVLTVSLSAFATLLERRVRRFMHR